MALILVLKIALILAVGGAVTFSVAYTHWTRWACWRDPIGLTIQLETWFFAGALAPLLVATFWHLNAFASKVGAWILVSFFGLAGLVFCWRTYVFGREHYRNGRKESP